MNSYYQSLNVDGRFYLREKLGYGSFGEIHIAEDKITKKRVAVKVEVCLSPTHRLITEKEVYECLNSSNDESMVPKAIWFGTLRSYKALVMELMGPSLETLFRLCDRTLSFNTIAYLGIQMLSCLEFLHCHSYLHRDVKPSNFVMGVGINCNNVYLIDFDVAKKYRDERGNHIAYEEQKDFVGNAKFASLRTFLQQGLSRADDLESLAYILFYFLMKDLPWQEGDRNNRQKMIDLRLRLTDIYPSVPSEFKRFLSVCRTMHFDEEPNYVKLECLIWNRETVLHKPVFEWSNLSSEKMKLIESGKFEADFSDY
ncbi:unnamed protein product [Dracunculus medinensis]|uniref:non-specific serine/threonine protein kinase n=1 Tax=Dracunculus medinensis TaxID=318479 RepID=A0A0N4UN35_DRAME|nr:unnamed protein product [Dracunculus medinensis]